ncbi:hypothetical protein Slin14017_G094100 [Septoria linicola]|nr:hypothetical protein Slin14017_G094100 [Septoria linicola]
MALIRLAPSHILLSTAVYAQESSSHLTMTFSPNNLSTCADRHSSQGITFTTSSIPLVPECFNLDEIFTSNTSSGLILQPIAGGNDPYQLTWKVHNRQIYDPNANYSRIRYQQTNGTGEIPEGAAAGRRFNAYPGRDCAQGEDEVTGERQWGYEMSCQSSQEGSCHETGLGIRSFLVAGATDANEGGECLDWVQQGAGARRFEVSMVVWMAAGLLVIVPL